MSQVPHQIFDKINKLLALSKNNSNVNEAAAAYAQAQALLFKHRISQAEVEQASESLNTGEKIGEAAPLYEGVRVVSWKFALACGLAKYNGCKVYSRHFDVFVKSSNRIENRIKFVLVGHPSDTEIVTYLFESICAQVDFMCQSYMQQGFGSGKTFGQSFRMGCVDTVLARIKEVSEQIREEYQGSSALVLVDKKQAEVTAWVNERVKLVNRATPVTKSVNARELGRRAGNKISLNKGMGGSKGPNRLS